MDQAFVPEKTSKLVIRVKMDASSNPSASTVNESDTEFNPVAVGILAIIILLLVGAGYYYFSSSNETVIPPEFEAQNAVPEISEQPTLAPPVVVEPEVATVIPMIEAQSMATEVEMPKPEVKEILQEPVLLEEKVVSTEPAIPVEVEPVIEKAPEPIDAPVVDFSVNVKRAQFTNDINKREPTDLVEGVVPAKAEGLKRIYFFSELMQLKGQTIRHQWLHEGKLQSEIKFDVRGNRWRVNSSKRLNPAAMGNWQVQVVNEAGDIMVSKHFEYKLP